MVLSGKLMYLFLRGTLFLKRSFLILSRIQRKVVLLVSPTVFAVGF